MVIIATLSIAIILILKPFTCIVFSDQSRTHTHAALLTVDRMRMTSRPSLRHTRRHPSPAPSHRPCSESAVPHASCKPHHRSWQNILRRRAPRQTRSGRGRTCGTTAVTDCLSVALGCVGVAFTGHRAEPVRAVRPVAASRSASAAATGSDDALHRLGARQPEAGAANTIWHQFRSQVEEKFECTCELY